MPLVFVGYMDLKLSTVDGPQKVIGFYLASPTPERARRETLNCIDIGSHVRYVPKYVDHGRSVVES